MPHQFQLRAALARAGGQRERLNVAFTVEPYWLGSGAADLQLHAAIDIGADGVQAVIASTPLPDLPLATLAERFGSPVLALDAPLLLQPIAVAKPWGRELWYTGIEARGHSCAVGNGHALPLAHLLALAPEYLCQDLARSLVLLKVLDPHPDESLGDLYFEVHDVKREVYVVTHVDQRAWPDGRGAIRFGMNQKLRRTLGGDAAFRNAYRSAVSRYEQVRRQIDALLDARRAIEGVALDAPVAPDITLQWLADVPKSLRDSEESLRRAMHRFTQLRRLEVGDVVAVPPLTPHALQHGVRVVEFQTPVYERQILSFTQKVLTQPHWDSAAAIAKMRLDAARTQVQLLANSPDVQIERIIDFPDFQVQRIRLARGATTPLPQASYALCLGIEGTTGIGATTLAPEQACFVPHAAWPQTGRGRAPMLRNDHEEDAVCLLALPRQHTTAADSAGRQTAQ